MEECIPHSSGAHPDFTSHRRPGVHPLAATVEWPVSEPPALLVGKWRGGEAEGRNTRHAFLHTSTPPHLHTLHAPHTKRTKTTHQRAQIAVLYSR